MEKYIDMHCHILPEVDDGAKNIEETRQMLEQAYADGIRYVIATPHYHPRRGGASKEKIREQARRVRQEAKKDTDRLREELKEERGVFKMAVESFVKTVDRIDKLTNEVDEIKHDVKILKELENRK